MVVVFFCSVTWSVKGSALNLLCLPGFDCVLSFATKMVLSQTRCAPASEVCMCGVDVRVGRSVYQPSRSLD